MSFLEERYYDELISWLKFNNRVINEAKRKINPILERFKFLGIADSNLDEFIRTKFRGGKKYKKLISEQTYEIDSLYESLKEELFNQGIKIISINDIKNNSELYDKAKKKFINLLYPVIQPLILAKDLPLPIIDDGGSFIISKFKTNERETSGIIRIPETTLIKIDKDSYIPSDEIILEFINIFYQGKTISEQYCFRVLRKVDNLYADEMDYLSGIKKQLKDREKAEIIMVDLNFTGNILKEYLDDNTKKRKRTYVFGLSFLKDIHDLIEEYPNTMAYPKAKPRVPVAFVGQSFFKVLSKEDVLIHFPYQDFQKSSVKFIEEAAKDPKVIAIKQTLYRVKKDSPIIKALCEAAENGKQVIVLLELKAKMDEKNNFEIASLLQNSGCHVIFGPVAMKTHAKITLVIRKEKDEISKYVNISTGNFNDSTAKQYEDISYFAKDHSKLKPGMDLCTLFNYLGGCSELTENTDLLISPISARKRFEQEINNCINSIKTHPEYLPKIIIKCNAFTDTQMADKIYEASDNGIDIDLIIRGMCIVKAGTEIGKNIRCRSIVGRYLEHSRIYVFQYINDKGKETTTVIIGSGDMMTRNLDYRVEVFLPIKNKSMKEQILELLNLYLSDNTHSYILSETGDYIIPADDLNENSIDIQNTLISKYKELEKNLLRG